MLKFTMVNQTKNGDDLFKDKNDFPEIIVITLILSLYSVIGTTGNAFVLYVFSRKKDKNTSTIFIIALACTDFLTCIFVIPFTIVVEFMYKKVDNDVVCKIYQFLITSNVPFSAFIMVAIAFDRYFCICRPWLKVLDIRLAKRVIFSLLVFSVTLGLITCLAYGVYHQTEIFVTYENTTLILDNSSLTNQSLETTQRLINDGSRQVAFNTSINDLTHNYNIELDLNMNTSKLLFTGFCYPNELILGRNIRKIYQKFYAFLFLIAFVTVFTLYAMIYKSILTRRSKRLRSTSFSSQRNSKGRRSTVMSLLGRPSQQHSKQFISTEQLNNQRETAFSNEKYASAVNRPVKQQRDNDCQQDSVTNVVTNHAGLNQPNSDCMMSNINSNKTTHSIKALSNKTYPRKCNNKGLKKTNLNQEASKNLLQLPEVVDAESSINGDHSIATTVTVYRQDTRKSVREKHMIANIKTAGILFIVTIVFILAFLPSWLMAVQIIPANMVVFYMYFSYNVANPVIYAFFNHTFQREVKYVLNCDK